MNTTNSEASNNEEEISDQSTPTPKPPFSSPCVVHSPMLFRGGGEQYAAELASALDAPLYTYRCTIDLEADCEIREFDHVGRLDRLMPKVPFNGLIFAYEYENFDVPKYHDAVITTGSTAKSVIHRPHQRRYHLLHTPPRWLYDRTHAEPTRSWPIKWLRRSFRSYLRVLDQSTISRIDDFVVNSETIGRRLETYYRRAPSAVIYPPVDVEKYEFQPGEGFLLYLGRLEPHKGVRDIIHAVNGTDYQLSIAGTGSLEEELRELSGNNVRLHGFVTEAEKRHLLATCDALVFNSDNEDFGIVPIEAMASGKPVVGVNEGFTSYQIKEGINGILFKRGPENLQHAITEMYRQEWDTTQIQHQAKEYDIESFRHKWQSLIQW